MAVNEQTNRIGRGIIYPLRRHHGDFENGTGKLLLNSCVRKVVATPAAGFQGKLGGTYPWRKNFGSFIALLRHSNMRSFGEDLAIVYGADAIERWEPRVEARTARSAVVPDTRDSRIKRLRIYFGISEELGGNVQTGEYENSYQEVSL